MYLFRKEGLLIQNKEYKVKHPGNNATENNPEDTHYKHSSIVCASALDNTVNCPNDVKEGKREDNLNNFGKVVKSLNKFHNKSPL